jgi:hypothetical protein
MISEILEIFSEVLGLSKSNNRNKSRQKEFIFLVTYSISVVSVIFIIPELNKNTGCLVLNFVISLIISVCATFLLLKLCKNAHLLSNVSLLEFVLIIISFFLVLVLLTLLINNRVL